MYCNVGKTDKIIRIIVGVLLVITAFVTENALFILGWVPIASGLLEVCPLYYLFGISTMKEKKKFWV